MPLATTLGNHEMYTLDWKMREPYAYLNYFAVPPNGNEIFNRRYYSYDFGDVHYVVLDTMLYESNHEDNHDTHHPDLYDVQAVSYTHLDVYKRQVLMYVHIWKVKPFAAYVKHIAMDQHIVKRYVKSCDMVGLECYLYHRSK